MAGLYSSVPQALAATRALLSFLPASCHQVRASGFRAWGHRLVPGAHCCQPRSPACMQALVARPGSTMLSLGKGGGAYRSFPALSQLPA